MKIISGPAEDRLYKHALDCFEKVQRVKPNASRQESKEIYFLCTNYGETLNDLVKSIKKAHEQLEDKELLEKNPEEAERIVEEIS